MPSLPVAVSPQSLLKAWLPILLFGVLWVDLVRQLSYTWETNDQYAYGWFVPFLAVGLFFRRWPGRPASLTTDRNFLFAAFCFLFCLFLLPLRVIHEINQDWPLISWPLTAAVVTLSLYAVFLSGGWRWVKYFAFPICFILVAVQWPYRIENSLTQNLMQVVASLSVEILGWFDIPALQRGNLIELSTGVLGVDEACSGIRSFQSTLMAALFLGELYRLRVPIRLLLVGAGLTAAFLLNLCRTLILTWQANANGPSAIDKWHDPAGFTIAVACFFAIWLLAVLIKRYLATPAPSDSPLRLERGLEPLGELRKEFVPGQKPERAEGAGASESLGQAEVLLSSSSPPPSGPTTQVSAFSFLLSTLRSLLSHFPLSAPEFRACRRYLVAVGCWSLLCIAATEVWFRSHATRRADTTRWWVSYPTNQPSFKPVTVSKASAKLLRHDAESGGSWDELDGTKWSVFCFRWKEGDPTARMSAQAHRPEYCLVGGGHELIAMSETQDFAANGVQLPFRLYTFGSDEKRLHVFFCLWEDGAETQAGFGKTKQGDRLRTVWAGRRGLGQQTFEIICSGYPDMATAEQAVRQRLPELIQIESRKPSTVAVGP